MSEAVTALRVLGEGPADRAIVRSLLHPRGLESKGVEYRPSYKGYDQLRKKLAAELGRTDAARFLIVVDADNKPIDRWRSITDKLRDCGYPGAPTGPPPGGCLLTPDDKRPVGLWMMPDNVHAGEIENLYEKLISQDPSFEHAGAVINGLPASARRFEVKDRLPLKAQIHTWLAWQAEPGIRSGDAIHAVHQSFQLDHPLVTALRKLADELLAKPSI